MAFAEAVQVAEAERRHRRNRGQLPAAKGAGPLQGRRGRAVPVLFVLGAVVEVTVDEPTGVVRVDKVWIAHDIGRALNPVLVRGQVEGSVYMALGEALMEEQAFRRLPARLSRALVHQTPSMLEYKSLASLDMPDDRDHPDRGAGAGRAVRGQGGRPGTAAADPAGGRQRRPRRGRRARRRGADHPGEGAGRPARPAPPARPEVFPDVPWPEPLIVPPPWEGGDGSAINERRPRERKPAAP